MAKPAVELSVGSAVEPWLRGTLTEVDALRRQVLHALEQAQEDVARHCLRLSDQQIHARPAGAGSVAFHLRHIAASLDRLLTYAEGGQLSSEQLEMKRGELLPLGSVADVLADFRDAVESAAVRVRGFSPVDYEEQRFVGRDRLATTLGGLLVHCAEHTQRHIGQAITTARIAKSIVPATLQAE